LATSTAGFATGFWRRSHRVRPTSVGKPANALEHDVIRIHAITGGNFLAFQVSRDGMLMNETEIFSLCGQGLLVNVETSYFEEVLD